MLKFNQTFDVELKLTYHSARIQYMFSSNEEHAATDGRFDVVVFCLYCRC